MVREVRDIFDDVDRGIAEIRERTAVLQSDSFRLTDIDGVGPSTASELRDAGIDSQEQLARVTPTQLEAISGIGSKTADKISREFQYGFNRFDAVDENVPEEVSERMAERTPEARRADRSFNAPVTLDEDEWLDDPDELDYPGADTIPNQRRAERVREKADKLGVGIETRKLPGQGSFAGDTAAVDTSSSFDPISTAAHEVGHGADQIVSEDRDGVAPSLLEDEQVREEAEQLAVERRSMVNSVESIEDAYDARDVDGELFADAFAVATEEPRKTKREAPNLFRKLEEETAADAGRF